MDAGAVDLLALFFGIVVALAITTTFFFAQRWGRRREWMIAAALSAVLLAVALLDLLRENPRQTYLGVAVVGAIVPVLGALGLVRATQPMRPRFRWPLIFLSTLVLLFGAMLFGATVLPRFLK